MLSAESRPLTHYVGLTTQHWWEAAGWTGVLVAAAVLRLAALGDRPLGTDEAQPALEAWRLWLGYPARDVDSSVLLLHSLLLAFGLFGASDLVARLPSVAAGLALAAAPLLLRPQLGRLGALGAGALLALSPIVVFSSRRVDPAILAVALLALLVGACARVLNPDRSDPTQHSALSTQHSFWPYAVPVLAALLLAADSVAVPAALAALAAAVLTWGPWGGEREAGSEGRRSWSLPPGPWSLPSSWPLPPTLALVLFAATLVLVGTAGLTHLRGLQAALVDPWVSWLAPYYPRATPIPWLYALVLYDLPLLAAAAAGLVLVVRRGTAFDHFLLWWTAFAALPLVFQPSDPVPYLLSWGVPLALLGGTAIGALPTLGWTPRGAGQSALLLALLAIDACFLVNMIRLLQTMLALPGGLGLSAYGRGLVFSGLILVFLALLHWRLLRAPGRRPDDMEGPSSARAVALGALALGVAFMLTVNGRLNYANYGAGGAELLRPEVLSPDLHALVEEMQAWARQDPHGSIAVGSALRPSLLWHLRDVPTVQFLDRPSDPALQGAARRGVWPAEAGAPAGERRPWRETVAIGAFANTGALWNWWLYRNSWLVPTRHDIIVVR